MTDNDSNKVLVVLVILVVFLSVAFTWKALALKAEASSGSDNRVDYARPTPAAPPITSGVIAINIQPSTKGGA